MTDPLVHVLVINWNGLEHLRECFESLLAGDYPHCRFVLLDNASTDGSVAYVHDAFGADPRVETVALEDNLGWSGGNNIGIRRALEAGADFVFLLNNDTVTAPDAVSRLVDCALENPGTGALAPKMLLYDYPDLLNSVGIDCSVIGSSWDIGLGRLDGPKWDRPRPVLGVCGGAMFLRSDALRKAGLLPDFGIYLDDLDLCLRIWDAGYRVESCPEARIRHKFSATMGQGRRARWKYYLNTRNRFRLVLRNWPRAKLARHLPDLLLGEARAVGRGLLDGDPWRASAHARAWAATAAYGPVAWSARRENARNGLECGRFWPLIRHDRLFFRGFALPERGWYPPERRGGLETRPMSARAWLDVPGGDLRLTHANWYPRLGETDIEVLAEGKVIAELRTMGTAETVARVPGGAIEFRARRIFDADDTGALCDYGGWMSVTPE